MVCRYLLWQTFTHIEISIRCHHLMKEQTSSVPHPQADATPLRACFKIASLSCSICCCISGLVPLICSQVKTWSTRFVPVCNIAEVRINICTRGCTVKAFAACL